MQVKFAAIVFSLAAVAVATGAEARPRRAAIVQGSGFLDLSEQARIASRENYVTQSNLLNRPIYSTFYPDSFGNDVLPGRFGAIGR